MIHHTFIHCDGIGPQKEACLWEAGIVTWNELALSTTLAGPVRQRAEERLAQSTRALKEKDGAFFEKHLPSKEMWRLYPAFKEKTVFLDIETTGLDPYYDEITVITLFDKKGVKALVQGKDLDRFPEIIDRYSLIITYNGKCFDMPFLHKHFPFFKKNYAHIDLRYDLARLGYKGGLKDIERQTGIHRDGALSLVDGFMAVRLWQMHERGNKKAFNTLIRYAKEDVLNMKPLMEMVYNSNIKNKPFNITPLEPEVLPQIKTPYDPDIIERLYRSGNY